MAAEEDDRTVIRPMGAAAQPHPEDAQRTRIAAPHALQAAPAPAPAPASGAAPTAKAAPDGDHGSGLPVGTYLGEFEILQVLGEGGFGIVYLATDHSLQRRVALKEYMPSSLATRSGATAVQVKSERYRETFVAGMKSFINEARLLASFDHPSLVKVYRFWEANGTAYMVMPFYEGCTLKEHLRELGAPPDEAWLRALLAPLTEALQVIHADQCYHRDIAPDNVILLGGNHQRPLLLDFGAARRVIGDMTQALTVILKPGYAPVEQYAEQSDMKQGAWTDVYALAAVVYFAITGKTPPPSVGRMLNDTYVALEKTENRRYTPHFLGAIDRALAVRAEARTASMAQLRTELGLHALAQRAASAPAQAMPSRARPVASPIAGPARPAAVAASRAPWGVIGSGVALLVLGMGAWWWLSPAPRARASAPVDAGVAVPTTPTMAAAAPAVPAPKGLDAAQEFAKLAAQRAAGFELDAAATKTQVRIGHDDIGFNLASPRAGWLYAFALAGDGTLAQVVPNTVSGAVRLKAGQKYRFPSGNGVVLDAAEPAGTVQLLLMVSARERDFSALELEKVGPMRLLKTGEAASDIVAQHAGAGSPLAGRVLCPSTGDCDASYGASLLSVNVLK